MTDQLNNKDFSRIVIFFLLMTFSLTWGIAAFIIIFPEIFSKIFGELNNKNPLYILAVYSPAIASLILVVKNYGISGLKGFLKRILKFKTHFGWWILILFCPPLVMFLGSIANGNYNLFDNFIFNKAMLGSMLFMFFLGPIEEFGWRGLLLPLLNRKFTAITSSLIIGFIWMFWHLPAFIISGTPHNAWDFLPFMIGGISISLLMSLIFNKSKGSLLLPFIFHFQLNNPLWPDAQPWDNYLVLAIALVFVFVKRKEFFSKKHSYIEVIQ